MGVGDKDIMRNDVVSSMKFFKAFTLELFVFIYDLNIRHTKPNQNVIVNEALNILLSYLSNHFSFNPLGKVIRSYYYP